MKKLMIPLSLAILTLWLSTPLLAVDKPVTKEAAAESGTAFSPTAALGSYSLTPDAADKKIDLNQSSASSGQSGFSPEITIGGQIEWRYFTRGTIK
jgi:hypothetical protein